MKTKLLLFFTIIATLAAGAASAQNPKRTVLYTLPEGEGIVYNEYAVDLEATARKFVAAAIQNTDDNRLWTGRAYTSILNGQRKAMKVGAGEKYEDKNNDLVVSVDSWDDFITFHLIDDGWFIRVRGRYYGPYKSGSYSIGDQGFYYMKGDVLYFNDESVEKPVSDEIKHYSKSGDQRAYVGNSRFKCYDDGTFTIDGKPFATPTPVEVYWGGGYGFVYIHQGERYWFDTKSGRFEKRPGYRVYNHDGSRAIISSDRRHLFQSSYHNKGVTIDGQLFGKAPAIDAVWNESKKAFVWNAVEGQELVVYEYVTQ